LGYKIEVASNRKGDLEHANIKPKILNPRLCLSNIF